MLEYPPMASTCVWCSLVEQLVVGNMHQIKACGICSNMGHQTDMCPTLQEDTNEHAHAMGGYQNQ